MCLIFLKDSLILVFLLPGIFECTVKIGVKF